MHVQMNGYIEGGSSTPGILLSLKKEELVTPARVWVDLEGTVLSDISQTQKGRSCLIPLLGGPQRSRIDRDRKWVVRPGTGGGGGG